MTAIESSHQAQCKPLLIIGDLINDRTIYCKATKISPEAPVPVAMIEPNGIVETPGGAGLAASYAKRNDIPLVFATYADEHNTDLIREIPSRIYPNPTGNVRKTRYVDVSSNYHLLRADTDLMVEYPDVNTDSFVDWWRREVLYPIVKGEVSGIVMLDYCKGIFDNEKLIRELIEEARAFNIPVYIDTRSKDLMKYKGANVLKLNTKEFEVASNALDIASGWQLCRKLELDCVILTHGKDGAELYKSEEGSARVVFEPDLSSFNGAPDVTGCGDVFDVTFCSSWCINKVDASLALEIAVEKATKFAYEPIEERLYVSTKRKDK